MRRPSPRFAVAIPALAMLLAACSTGTEPSGGAGPAPSSAAPDTPAPSTDASPSASERGTANDAGVGTPAPAPPPPGEAPVTAPPTAGLYRYSQEGRGVFGDYPAEGTLRIRPATLADDGQRQRQVRTIDDDQITESTFRFTDEGVWLEQITQRVGSGSFAQTITCTLEPAILVVRLPLKVGARWDGSSTCQGLDVSFRASFLREERLTIAGERVDTIVLRANFEASGSSVEQTTVTTSWISPAHRLIVRSTEESSGRQGAIEYSSTMTETLLDLDPA